MPVRRVRGITLIKCVAKPEYTMILVSAVLVTYYRQLPALLRVFDGMDDFKMTKKHA